MPGVPVVLAELLSDNCGMPSLAVSILKKSLKERIIPSKVFYANTLSCEIACLGLIEDLLESSIETCSMSASLLPVPITD